MKQKKQPTSLPVAGLLLLLLLLAGCPPVYEGEIITEARSLLVDVKNNLFSSSNLLTQWQRGLGLSEVQLTVICEDAAGEEVAFKYTMEAGEVDNTYAYTQLPIEIEGTLLRVTARAEQGTDTFTASLADKKPGDIYQGWTAFANIQKVKLDYQLNQEDFSQSRLELAPGLRGGSNARVLVDSGVQADYAATTSYPDLGQKEIAVEVLLSEHPAGITFDLYTLVVNENLSSAYDVEASFEANYNYYPWSSLWTYAEITSTGKTVGGEENIYVLEKYNSDPLAVYAPLGNGNGTACLIDLTTMSDPRLLDKALLIAVVLRYGDLQAPLDVVCVDID